MRVLMFGWEFPPHISGGLGTASYGLTKGMTHYDDMEVVFVVPKAYGDEDKSVVDKIVGAGDISITKRKIKIEESSIDYFEVDSQLIPYVGEQEYLKITRESLTHNAQLIETDKMGRLHFTGKYGTDLLGEIYRYSVVASSIAEQNSFDVIHAHDWLAYPAGIAAKKQSGKPLVIHVHATDFDRSGGKVNPTVFNIEKEGMEAADQIITVSNLTRNIVINHYGINPDKITTVYNAVEPISESAIDGIKRNLDEKIVTFLGRITMQKGPAYFVEAAERVLAVDKNVRFVMAGNGDMMNEMIDLAAKKGITDRFHFTGFLKGDDVFKMLKISDVYIMPSVSEPFGISPLEAMQAGVPVIISKQSGVAEVVTHAIKVDYWDINALADAIYSIINNDGMHSMLKDMGTKEINTILWKKSAGDVRDVYIKAIESAL